MSTEEQGASGAGLEAQKAAIAAECERRGWELVETIEDRGYSAKDLKRPGIQLALEILKRKQAHALVIAKLDRVSRSMLDLATIMQRAQREGWALVALDCPVDTSTPAGEAMAHVLATFAVFERRLISQRTREALAVKAAQGVRIGRPRQLPDDVYARVQRGRDEGRSWPAIAAGLNEEGIQTARGGKRWYTSTVQAAYRTARRGAPTPTARAES